MLKKLLKIIIIVLILIIVTGVGLRILETWYIDNHNCGIAPQNCPICGGYESFK